MLRFRVFCDGKPADSVELSGAYLVGSDGVPVRAEIEYAGGEIVCRKRAAGPAGLALLWPVEGVGRIMIETTRLQERDRPYLLQLELARARLTRLLIKQEDWSMDDKPSDPRIGATIEQSRNLLISALQADDEPSAARLADESLALAVQIGEEYTLEHAGAALAVRRQSNGGRSPLFGCKLDTGPIDEGLPAHLSGAFDFVCVPICWKQIEPSEQKFNWKPLDTLVEWLAKQRIPMKGSSLVSFSEDNVPNWLSIWEDDFETVRDLVYEHIRRIVTRYSGYIHAWDVVSGLHARNCISFNFDQLMELTRMAAATTKQLAPRSTTIVDLVAPWGEYYARNQRTIPPALYADMVVQSGVNFDAFGLHFYFGVGTDGMYVRDLFQVSSMIDRFSLRNKPLHITGVQVPSSTRPDKSDAWNGSMSVVDGGTWRAEWSEELQARWLESFYRIALSKPFIDSVTWRDLSDRQAHYLPHGGLLRPDMTAKPAYRQLVALRKEVQGNGR